MFASIELAARVDRSEGSLMAAATHGLAAAKPGVDTMVRELDGGVATIAGPQSPMNKVIGVGFDGPIDPAAWDAVEAAHDRRGMSVQVELSTLADQSVAPALMERGYRLVGFENVLGVRLPRAPRPAATPVHVAPSDDGALEAFIDLIVTGFVHPDTDGVAPHDAGHDWSREVMEESIRDIMRADGFVRYVAELDGAASGAASMRLHDGIALLCGAATLPDQRRRGVQTALTDRRLADAATLGCDLAVVVTQPGSRSAANSHRQGFELLYSRAVLVREAGEA